MLMIAQQGYSPPQELGIGEKLLWKYDETHYFVFLDDPLAFYSHILCKSMLCLSYDNGNNKGANML